MVGPYDYLCCRLKLNDVSPYTLAMLCVCECRESETPDRNAHTHIPRGQSKPFLKQIVSNSSVCVCCQKVARWDHVSAGQCIVTTHTGPQEANTNVI